MSMVRNAREIRGGQYLVELVGSGTTTRRWVATNLVDKKIRTQVVREAAEIVERRMEIVKRAQLRAQIKNDRNEADRRSLLRREAERIKKVCS